MSSAVVASASKRCRTCGEEKPLAQFSRDRTHSDGLRSYCRSCDSARTSKYYRDHRTEMAAHQRQYVLDHAESVAEYQRQYRIDHVEFAAAYNRKYRLDNAESVSAGELARKTPKRAVINAAKTPCPVCGEADITCLDLHHVDPSKKLCRSASMLNKKMDFIVAELAKCISICSNCHRKYHAGNQAVMAIVDG